MSESSERAAPTAAAAAGTQALSHLWLRLVVLASIVMVANAWCVHHLGAGLSTFLIPSAIAGVMSVMGTFMKPFGDEEQGKVRGAFRRILTGFLRTPVLTLLVFALLIAGSVVSSVTVLAGGTGQSLEVALAPEGGRTREKDLDGQNDVVRFVTFVTPFGRPYYLLAKGYQRYSFDVLPWVGKTIRVSRDLTIAPSLLIRVPVGFHKNLSTASLVLETDAGTVLEVSPLGKDRGAVLVGPPVGIPDAFIPNWERELTAEVQDIDRGTLNRIVLRWLRPLRVEPKESLAPGQRFTARLVLSDSTCAALTSIVGDERLQDVILERSQP